MRPDENTVPGSLGWVKPSHGANQSPSDLQSAAARGLKARTPVSNAPAAGADRVDESHKPANTTTSSKQQAGAPAAVRYPFQPLSSNVPAVSTLRRSSSKAMWDPPAADGHGPLATAIRAKQLQSHQAGHCTATAAPALHGDCHSPEALGADAGARCSALGHGSAQQLQLQQQAGSWQGQRSFTSTGSESAGLLSLDHGWERGQLDTVSTAGALAASASTAPPQGSMHGSVRPPTPGSGEAFMRLQQQQQLRWQQQTNRALAASSTSSRGQAVPFTQHPAVSTLHTELSSLQDGPSDFMQHPPTSVDWSCLQAARGSGPAGLHPSSSSCSLPAASEAVAALAGQPTLLPAAGSQHTDPGDAAAADIQAIWQKLHAAQLTAKSAATTGAAATLRHTLLNTQADSSQPCSSAGASSPLQTLAPALPALRATDAPAECDLFGVMGLHAGTAARAQQPCLSRFGPLAAGRLAQHPGVARPPDCSHSSAVGGRCSLVRGLSPLSAPAAQALGQPARLVRGGVGALSVEPGGVEPCVSTYSHSASRHSMSHEAQRAQCEQAEHMFVRLHRTQRPRQQPPGQQMGQRMFAQDPSRTAGSTAGLSSTSSQLLPVNASAPAAALPVQANPAASSSSDSSRAAVLAEAHGHQPLAAPARVRQHLGAVDNDGLPVPGPLAPASTLRTAYAAGHRPQQSNLFKGCWQPLSTAAAAGSILDTVQLRSEGQGSAASAIQGIACSSAAATGATDQKGPLKGGISKAMDVIAAKTASLLHRQQAQKPSSRLQAATYPAGLGLGSTAGVRRSLQLSSAQHPQPSAAVARSVPLRPAAEYSSQNYDDTLWLSRQAEMAAAYGGSRPSTAAAASAGSRCSRPAAALQPASVLPPAHHASLRTRTVQEGLCSSGSSSLEPGRAGLSAVTSAATQLLHQPQPQRTVSSSWLSTHSSVNSTGRSSGVAALLADPLRQHSRLSLWQQQPPAGLESHQSRVSVRCHSNDSSRAFLGADRPSQLAGGDRGAARGQDASDHSPDRPSGRHGGRSSQPVQLLPSPTSPAGQFLSPIDPGSVPSCGAPDVFATPEAEDSSSGDSAAATGSCSCSCGSPGLSAVSNSSTGSLVDTAQSALSYAFPKPMLGLARATPFAGLTRCADDYLLTALQKCHGLGSHHAVFWVQRERDARAAQFGSPACRRLTWDDDPVGPGTQPHPHRRQQQGQQQLQRQPMQAQVGAVQLRSRRLTLHTLPAGQGPAAMQVVTPARQQQQERRQQQQQERGASRRAAVVASLARRRRKPWQTDPLPGK